MAVMAKIHREDKGGMFQSRYDLTPTQRRILIWFLTEHKIDLWIHASEMKVRAAVGCSKATFWAAISRLEEDGWLKRWSGMFDPYIGKQPINRYFIFNRDMEIFDGIVVPTKIVKQLIKYSTKNSHLQRFLENPNYINDVVIPDLTNILRFIENPFYKNRAIHTAGAYILSRHMGIRFRPGRDSFGDLITKIKREHDALKHKYNNNLIGSKSKRENNSKREFSSRFDSPSVDRGLAIASPGTMVAQTDRDGTARVCGNLAYSRDIVDDRGSLAIAGEKIEGSTKVCDIVVVREINGVLEPSVKITNMPLSCYSQEKMDEAGCSWEIIESTEELVESPPTPPYADLTGGIRGFSGGSFKMGLGAFGGPAGVSASSGQGSAICGQDNGVFGDNMGMGKFEGQSKKVGVAKTLLVVRDRADGTAKASWSNDGSAHAPAQKDTSWFATGDSGQEVLALRAEVARLKQEAEGLKVENRKYRASESRRKMEERKAKEPLNNLVKNLVLYFQDRVMRGYGVLVAHPEQKQIQQFKYLVKRFYCLGDNGIEPKEHAFGAMKCFIDGVIDGWDAWVEEWPALGFKYRIPAFEVISSSYYAPLMLIEIAKDRLTDKVYGGGVANPFDHRDFDMLRAFAEHYDDMDWSKNPGDVLWDKMLRPAVKAPAPAPAPKPAAMPIAPIKFIPPVAEVDEVKERVYRFYDECLVLGVLPETQFKFDKYGHIPDDRPGKIKAMVELRDRIKQREARKAAAGPQAAVKIDFGDCDEDDDGGDDIGDNFGFDGGKEADLMAKIRGKKEWG